MFRFLSLGLVALILIVTFRPDPEPDKRILFIGNSFTFGGDVPTQVHNIALTADPSVRYEVVSVVRGGTTLQEHIAETAALETIRQGGWDVVVLQDASVMSFRENSRLRMRAAAAVLAAEARAQGAEVLYYAHWAPGARMLRNWAPYPGEAEAIGQIRRMYQSIAADTGGTVALAGQLWLNAGEAGITGLYSADGHHASLKGAWAAALAIVAALGDTDPGTSSWSPAADGQEISAAEQDLMRGLASSFVMRTQ